MRPSQRVITELSLQALWDDSELLSATWSRNLSVAGLRELLRQGSVRFVVADVGSTPRWVPEVGCFDFWKKEVQPHLSEPELSAYLERFPDGYCYYAAEWEQAGGSPIVVLSRSH